MFWGLVEFFLGVCLGVCGGLSGIFWGFGVAWLNFWRLCHFEPFAKRRKIHIVILSVSEISTEFKIRFLNLWILRCAQYDKIHQYDKQKIFVVCLGVLVVLGIFGVEFC